MVRDFPARVTAPAHDHASIEIIAIAQLRPHPRNARRHSKKQIRQIADSIKTFGFINPILVGDGNEIVAGHGRVEAAKLIGFTSVPALRLADLNAAQRRAYRLADNKIALNAGWDRKLLASELQGLVDLDFDVEVTGFSLPEVKVLLEEAVEASPTVGSEADDEILPPHDPTSAITRPHRLVCGDRRSTVSSERLTEGGRAAVCSADPPPILPIGGGGDMSPETFSLCEALGHTPAFCREGAIAYVGISWRHIGEWVAMGQVVFSGVNQSVAQLHGSVLRQAKSLTDGKIKR